MDESVISRRDPGGRWAPGVSPNPGGKPKTTRNGKSLPELCRVYTEDMLRLLHQVAMDPAEPTPMRVTAAEAILRRGWGDKPATLGDLPDNITFIVQQLNPVATPTPGVLTSPVQGHIQLPRLVVNAGQTTGEVIDEERPWPAPAR
jgi:hypothetical protein